MPDLFFYDSETYSETDIRKGTDNYARNAEIMLHQYALNDGPVQYFDATAGGKMPAFLEDHLLDDRVLKVAHNAAFDRQVLLHNGYDIPITSWYCTMAQALAHSLPGGLDKLCEIFQIDEDKAKIKDGKALIQLFCKPRPKKQKLRRATRETHPEEWARFLEYGVNDIAAMREIHKKMPKWNYGYEGREIDLWRLDQKINQRGVTIDVHLVESALATAERVKASLAEDAQDMTDGAVMATTQRDALLSFLADQYDLELENARASTLEKILKTDDNLPETVRALLLNRLAASSTSVSKYASFAKLTGPDGRLRNTLQYCGAMRTGRWAGRGVQLQNLPRPSMKNKAIEAGIEAIKCDAADLIYDNPMELLSSSVRGAIIAPHGKKLSVADLSNIEGRMLAWLAGEEWKLEAFRRFDTCKGVDGEWYTGDQVRDSILARRPIALALDKKGEPIRAGHDLYALAYAKAFGVSPEAVMDNKANGDGSWRQGGKVLELACFAPDTQVITNNGIKDIVAVLDTDLLWDGEEWVRHKGLVAKGVRQVVNVAGTRVTPDHQILIKNSWIPAKQLATCENTLSLALATGSENLPWSDLSGRVEVPVITTWLESSVLAALNRILSTITTSEKGNPQGATPAQRSNQDVGEKTILGTPIYAPMTEFGEHFSTGFPPASTDATILKTQDIKTTVAEVSTSTNPGEKTDALSSNTCLLSTVGTTKNSNLIEQTSTVDTNRGICDLSPGRKTKEIDEKCRPCNSESQTLSKKTQTYDIAFSGPRNRFTILTEKGPLIVHNCGYQGSVGAFATFAIAYGTDLEQMATNALPNIPPATFDRSQRAYEWALGKDMTFGMSELAWRVCWCFVRLWRDANPNIEAYWKRVESGMKNAILNAGKTVVVNSLRIVKQGVWVRVVLPSGRSLCYPSPRLSGEDEKLSYMGVNQFSRQWSRINSYGGKLAENVTQAASRDVLGWNLPEIEQAGYEVVSLVHDEDITETEDDDLHNADHLAAMMACNPHWATGLPLAAAGFDAYRYRKD